MKSPVLSILFLLISVTLLAVPNDFRFRHFSVEDGLSSNSVRAIMQDKYGFLWIGTEEGLNRYDGIMINHIQFAHRQQANTYPPCTEPKRISG